MVGLVEEAPDGDLQIDHGPEDTALEPSFGELSEEALHRVEPGTDVGVKWKVKRSWRASQARTLGCLWAA